MSNRNSILAIGVAALFMICALSAALVIANTDSDTSTSDTNTRAQTRSYSSYSSDTSSAKADEKSDAIAYLSMDEDDITVTSIVENKKVDVKDNIAEAAPGANYLLDKRVSIEKVSEDAE